MVCFFVRPRRRRAGGSFGQSRWRQLGGEVRPVTDD
jgi:hypothetical protein